MGLLMALMLLAMVVLSLPASSATATASDVCAECGLQCANEAWYYMMECRRNGGSDAYCTTVYNDYVNNCKAIFCNYGLNCRFEIN